jgi:hypothetical protein
MRVAAEAYEMEMQAKKELARQAEGAEASGDRRGWYA